MSLQFKTVPIEFENRHKIIPVGKLDSSELDSINPDKGELKIRVLSAKGCPLNRGCVGLNHEDISSFCDYLGPYPSGKIDTGKPGGKLPCQVKTPAIILDVEILMVDGCPNGNTNCVGCDDLEDAVIWDEQDDKSHCYIKCKK